MNDHLKASPPERYEDISRHLLAQAQEELDKGDILQASDKVWGATAHAVKAVCQRMGWNHHAHNHLSAAVNFISADLDRNDLLNSFGSLEAMHSNYYEHQMEAYQVRVQLKNAALFTSELAALALEDLLGDQSHLTSLERQGQERLLRTLTRKTQYSHGPQYSDDETSSLPPVKPAPPATAETE